MPERCTNCGCFKGYKEHTCKPVWSTGKHYTCKKRPGFTNQTSFKKGHIVSNELKEKLSKLKKEVPLSEIHKNNISKSLMGHKNWAKSKHTEETKEKMRKSMRNYINEHPDFIKKSLIRNSMSSLEIKMNDIIIKNNLPYKFVGNGEFLIGRKCPDFINNNGEKIAIEVYFKRHKEKFRNGLDEWKKEREIIFNKYGWKLLFLDETYINNENAVLSLLAGDNI